MLQHDLCVIAGNRGFCHTGSAVRTDNQQDTGFDLSRSNFGLIVNAVELTFSLMPKRCTAVSGGILSISAPIWLRGSMIRFMGRLWMDSSPFNSVIVKADLRECRRSGGWILLLPTSSMESGSSQSVDAFSANKDFISNT